MKTKPRTGKRVVNEKMYLVGFLGKAQIALYSKRAWASYSTGEGGVEKMTLWQAKRCLEALGDGQRTIFKVLPLPTPKKGKKK